MSNALEHAKMEAKAAFNSGQPGTTGREPFEDSINNGDFARVGNSGNNGNTSGVLGGEHAGHHHHSHSGQGLAATEQERGAHVPGMDNRGQSDIGVGQSGASRVEERVEDKLPHGHQDKHRGTETGMASLAGAPYSAPEAGRETSTRDHEHGERLAEHNRHGDGSGVTATSMTGNNNNAYGNNDNNLDRIGDRNQEGALYDRTGAGGPVTGGAANTDKFDTDRNAGITGGGTREPGEATRRGEGLGSGGVGGVLGTTDKEFAGRDRLANDGAYSDSHGHFKKNTDGPDGNTALTGREGDLSKNPVANSEGNDAARNTSTLDNAEREGRHVGGAETRTGEHGAQHKEGLMDKVKHALGK